MVMFQNSNNVLEDWITLDIVHRIVKNYSYFYTNQSVKLHFCFYSTLLALQENNLYNQQ